MKHLNFFVLCLLLVSCMSEDWAGRSGRSMPVAVFKLEGEGYVGEQSRSVTLDEVRYDRVAYYVVDEAGELVKDIKSRYDASTAEILVEGLHEGAYRLLVLGIKGDERKDRASILDLQRAADCWLSFPAALHTPLEAEYF